MVGACDLDFGLACDINVMKSKDVLGEINAGGDNGRHGLLLPQNERVDERSHVPSWHFDAVLRNCADHSGRGSPFHSLAIDLTDTHGQEITSFHLINLR